MPLISRKSKWSRVRQDAAKATGNVTARVKDEVVRTSSRCPTNYSVCLPDFIL